MKDVGNFESEKAYWELTHNFEVYDHYELRHIPGDNYSDSDVIIKMDKESLHDLTSMMNKITF